MVPVLIITIAARVHYMMKKVPRKTQKCIINSKENIIIL